MKIPITIQVRDFTRCPFAVAVEDGENVHDVIAPELMKGNPVALSFAGIEIVIAAFLGAAIGQLYGEMPSEDVDALLSIRCLDGEHLASLNRAVANSQRYFENPAAYDAAWKEVVDHESG